MNFFEAVWSKLAGSGNPAAATPAAQSGASSTDALGGPGPQRPPTRARIEAVALRAVETLAGKVLADPERVKWVLLQPQVDLAARRFVSLSALGEKRSTEAREAREALRSLLEADLPTVWPEHIEMLLDVMQTEARRVIPQYGASAGPSVRETTADTGADGAPPAARDIAVVAAAPVRTQPPLQPVALHSETPSAAAAVTPAAPTSGAVRRDDGSMAPIEYELHAVPGTTIEDVDMGLIREYLQGSTVRRPWSALSEAGDAEVIRALKAVDGPPGAERLTVLGALFFTTQPERHVVQSKVRFVEFPGVEVVSSTEKVAYRYSEEIAGTIPQLIARMERLHKERLAPGVLTDDGFRVEELPAVPLFALREAMVNAVCHRDYSLVGANIQVRLFADRLEVQSPGGLPGPVTVQNILTESYARNPRVADILRDLGYVERHGLGIDNMVKSMEEARLPPPEFGNTETSFTVTLRFRLPDESDPESWLVDIGAGSMDHDHQKALVFARRTGQVSCADYQSMNLANEGEANDELRTLVRAGWLLKNGAGTDPFYTLGHRSLPSDEVDDGSEGLPRELLESLSSSQRRILDIVIRHGKVKASEVLDISGLKDRRTVQRTLAALTEQGLVVRRATSKTDPNATYEVNREFSEAGPAQTRTT